MSHRCRTLRPLRPARVSCAAFPEYRLPKAVSLSLGNGKRLLGEHPRMRKLFGEIHRVAQTDAAVLICGETGTGKELVARAIHESSPRRHRELVAVNCATLPEPLVENELFGHCQGSFTGALTDKRGLVEAASGGTLLLDEIASLPIVLQSRLLRVLDNQTIRRLGETRERRVDVRILAATNVCLAEHIRLGQFREDLYYRLNVFQLRIPPLRDRSSDVFLLVYYFLHRLNGHQGQQKQITSEALELLIRHPFPGNVRELENLLESTYHLSANGQIGAEDISSRLCANTPEPKPERFSQAAFILEGLGSGRLEFWTAVRDRFRRRELSPQEVQTIISLGLSECGGSYRRLLRHLGLPQEDYRRFLAFLSRHKCKVDFRPYRK